MAGVGLRLRPDKTVLFVCDIQDRFREHISHIASVVASSMMMVCKTHDNDLDADQFNEYSGSNSLLEFTSVSID